MSEHEVWLQKTNSVLEVLKARDFVRLRQSFPLPFRWLLTAGILEKAWNVGTLLHGNIVSFDKPRIHSTGWILTVVRTLVRGERSNFGVSLTFCKRLGLVGLKFVPSLQVGFFEREDVPPYISYDYFSASLTSIRTGLWLSSKAIIQFPSSPGRHPAVLMLTGSGNGDLDSTVGALQPFRDIAEGLASNGIVSLRIEKQTWRCIMKQFITKSITTDDEYLPQSLQGLKLLASDPRVDPSRIFVLGHSLGGRIAPRLCSMSEVPCGIILMAANSRPLIDSIIYQSRWTQKAFPRDLDQYETDMAGLLRLRETIEKAKHNQIKSKLAGLGNVPSSYFIQDFCYDATGTLRDLQIPKLVLQGENDFQVTVDEDFQAWKEALSNTSTHGNGRAVCKTYKDLNHCFTTNRPEAVGLQQYNEPEHVANDVIQDLVNWVKFGSIRSD